MITLIFPISLFSLQLVIPLNRAYNIENDQTVINSTEIKAGYLQKKIWAAAFVRKILTKKHLRR
ncbi:MAG TPA: hypothetical protein VIJ57_10300 [Hanamia sp.]